MPLPSHPRHRAWAIAGLLWTLNIPPLLAPALVTGAVTPGAIVTVVTLMVGGWLICALLYEWLHRRAQRATGDYLMSAVGAALVGALALGLIDGVGGLLSVQAGLTTPKPLSYSAIRAVTNTIFVGWIFGIFVASTVLIELWQRLRLREEQLATAENQTAQARETATAARLAALRYQLNPHFLFNTLNAVSSAVVTGRIADAETMLSRLASFLRITLSSDSAASLTLEEELGTVESYLEIEAERFRERLATEIRCPVHLRKAVVPSFILQPLVENTMKHGVSRSRSQVRLVIDVQTERGQLVIRVMDDAEPAGGGLSTSGSGIGLSAIRERLEVLYGPEGVLTATPLSPGFCVELRMPLQEGVS